MDTLDQLLAEYPVSNKTPERPASFSFHPPPVVLPTYDTDKFHSSNFGVFDAPDKNRAFYRLVPFLVQAKASLLSAFRKMSIPFYYLI